VSLDYHVEIEKHFYSVPFRLLREEVEARVTARTVEIFHRGKLVAAHLRSLRPHRPTTIAEHMPSSHRRYRDWTHERIQREAAAIGDDTAALVEIILRSRPHPEQGFRSCIGILRLAQRYDAERLDGACVAGIPKALRAASPAKSLNDSMAARVSESRVRSDILVVSRNPGLRSTLRALR
jgi:transposase